MASRLRGIGQQAHARLRTQAARASAPASAPAPAGPPVPVPASERTTPQPAAAMPATGAPTHDATPDDESTHPHIDPGITAAVLASTRDDDPRRFLLRVMNDETVDMALRIEAAKALLPR